MGWLAWPGTLRKRGIVGLNHRNAQLISLHNPRRYFPRVDNKLLSKKLAQEAGIAVPQLYAVARTNRDASNLDRLLDGHDDFVIKPAHGAGGEGIVIITGRIGDYYRRGSGALMSRDDLRHHISNIISGLYSLGGQPDQAMIEQRVEFDPLFEHITWQGVPDIRTVVYRGVPVMAMVRLPTRMADGKANLHQGAVGAGVDIATGTTLRGVWRNTLVDVHPDTGAPIQGLKIPQWERLLELSARCHALSGLGYLGVDVVLDARYGPLMLELNARPGLNIQLANRHGLAHRIRAVDRDAPVNGSSPARVAFAMQRFAADPAELA